MITYPLFVIGFIRPWFSNYLDCILCKMLGANWQRRIPVLSKPSSAIFPPIGAPLFALSITWSRIIWSTLLNLPKIVFFLVILGKSYLSHRWELPVISIKHLAQYLKLELVQLSESGTSECWWLPRYGTSSPHGPQVLDLRLSLLWTREDGPGSSNPRCHTSILLPSQWETLAPTCNESSKNFLGPFI
jgi:hypothetical protein